MTCRAQPYPRELRERALRLVAAVTPNYDFQWAAINNRLEASPALSR
jgi:transposase